MKLRKKFHLKEHKEKDKKEGGKSIKMNKILRNKFSLVY